MAAALFVGLGLGFWQQASGSEAAVYYSPHVLEVSEERPGNVLVKKNQTKRTSCSLSNQIKMFCAYDRRPRRWCIYLSVDWVGALERAAVLVKKNQTKRTSALCLLMKTIALLYFMICNQIKSKCSQAAGMSSRGLLLAGTCMVGVFKLLGEVLAALLIER